MDFAVPQYGAGALSDVGPSMLAALGVPGEPNPLQLNETARVVLFVVDGLGWVQLQQHAAAAPYLSSMQGRALTAGFPSTTATSLASIGTGRTPGEHGFTGYTSYVESVGAVVNWLTWKTIGDAADLREVLVPEELQPQPTVWERAAAEGIVTTVCTYDNFAATGLTRAVLRGGRWGGTLSEGDAVARAADASGRGHRSLVYVYVSALDLIGHMRGPNTDAWVAQLSVVDHLAAQIGQRLSDDATLLVTADHGMVRVPDEAKVDYDASPALQEGVVALAGEPRMRHVHCRARAGDVAARWRSVLGDGWCVLTRDEAVDAGLFGADVSAAARGRIGDVLAFALGDGGIVERRKLPRLSAMPGQHGSVTPAEMLVPLLSS
jgi:hypothetical protein